MIDILFENQDFIACIKPIGIQSQCDGADDMVHLLEKQLSTKIYPVHRLDTAVGGTMIFAKNRMAAAVLSKEIAERHFEKSYLAVIDGKPENREGRFEDFLFKDSRKNKSYVVKRERKGVKKASLDYSVVQECDEKTLVSVHLNTGRSHQIRVQFASRGMPLLGDGKYGSRDNSGTIALWSHRINFNFKSSDYEFESEPNYTVYPWKMFK